MSKISPIIVLRYSFAALFLWFGYAQLTDASVWVGFLPGWTGYFPIPGEMLVQINGLAEVVAAFFLIFNVYTRLVAGLLGLHLLAIAVTAGGAIGARDAVLAMIGVAIAMKKED
jgi:uncharacterized membrane protein YphA (DoxX/SURF4 family)